MNILLSKKMFICFFIAGIFILGFFLRAQESLSGNFLFLIDQGRDLMDVRKIVFDHKPTLIGPYTSLGGIFQGPIWYYLLSIPVFMFQGDPRGTVYLMLFLSMAVLFVVYKFLNDIFGSICAIIGLILFATSPEAIAAATYSWNPHPMWLLIVFYLVLIFNLLKFQNQKIHLLIWPVILLMFNFEAAFGVILFVSTLIYLIFDYKKFLLNRYFPFGILLSGIFIFPLILFDFRHNFLMSMSVVNLFHGSSQGLFAGNEYQGRLTLFSSNLLTFWNNFNSGFFLAKMQIPFASIIILFLYIAGIVTISLNKFRIVYKADEYLFLKMLYSLFSIFLILSLIYPFPIRYWFLTGFQSFYLFIISILLFKLWQIKIGKLVIIGIWILAIWYAGNNLNNLYISPPNDGGTAKIKGKLSAIDYIYHDANHLPFGVLVFTPPVNPDAYDYLFWWYGSKKYKYIPHNHKRGLVYLLIEPDGSKIWSYRGWLETVIKDGDVLDTVTLPSGFIIQKRMFP
jgi:hypothetical protein